MAHSVAACALAYDILSGGSQGEKPELEPGLIIPTNYGMDDLDPAVATGFRRAVILKSTGFSVEEKPLAALEEFKALPIWRFKHKEI